VNKIVIRTIEAKAITVYADETGMVYVNDRRAGCPVAVAGTTFVWAGEAEGLPAHSKIAFDKTHIAAINAHSAAYVAGQQAIARKARAHDMTHNEGGEGYNPHRGG